jgi:acyl carrier protein
VSSVVNGHASANGSDQEDHGSNPRVIHFDATARRKERMRQIAGRDESAEPALSPVDAAPPAPTPRLARVFSPPPPVKAAPVQAAPVAPPAPAPAPAKPAIDEAELEQVLVGFVVEQTGYPAEMVELDADLEADLGIDSIKKAQLLGELAERFDLRSAAAGAGGMSLDDFPTLRHVLSFLKEAVQKEARGNGAAVRSEAADAARGAAAAPVAPRRGAAAPMTAAAPAAKAGPSEEELAKLLVDFVVEQTGYPPEMVELDADLEADLGIDSIKKAQLLGELAERLDLRSAAGAGPVTAAGMSLDDFPTLRHILEFLKGVLTKPHRVGALPDGRG